MRHRETPQEKKERLRRLRLERAQTASAPSSSSAASGSGPKGPVPFTAGGSVSAVPGPGTTSPTTATKCPPAPFVGVQPVKKPVEGPTNQSPESAVNPFLGSSTVRPEQRSFLSAVPNLLACPDRLLLGEDPGRAQRTTPPSSTASRGLVSGKAQGEGGEELSAASFSRAERSAPASDEQGRGVTWVDSAVYPTVTPGSVTGGRA